MLLEAMVCTVAMRGSVLETSKRTAMQYILYLRLTVMLVEAGWLSLGIAWLVKYYLDCPVDNAKEIVLGMVIFNWCILLSVIITVWCTYDSAGRSWVKMKKYQRSMRESESKFQYKRSGSTRNWRQRKVLRAYQDSWQNRCRFLFCCSTASDRNRNSFADIARLLSDFFRDLDVVPSDVIVGLVLLRKFQKIEQKAIVEQRKNDTYEFLSGVAITPRTQFLALHEEGPDLELFQTVIHFAQFAVRAYGWPIYMMTTRMGMCHLCAGLSCYCCIPCTKANNAEPELVEDNCCHCNFAALQRLTALGDIEIIYATYHVDVGQTPFFVALDYDRSKIVISIRGTLSMKDILTDLNAEGETLPLDPPRDDWLGHKGMVQAAQYILEKLDEEKLIERAKEHRPERGTRTFDIVCVGHSLGAGAASILGVLLRQRHQNLECYCYSPPGGLLSAPAVEYTKEFTVSVVVGKDVVPRIGLYQMETLRTDLINAIKRSVDPKWKTIACSVLCCGCSQPTSAVELSTGEKDVCEYMRSKENARCMGLHPSDSSIALTSHQPLFPPGRIIHIVRHHPTVGQQALNKKDPVYQALWAANTDFDEVLISPVMIQDHMPDRLLEALDKVVTTLGPKKPQRSSSGSEPSSNFYTASSASNPTYFLETSFASLQLPSSNSSITNGYYSTRSHPSPLSLQQFSISDNHLKSPSFIFVCRSTKSQPMSTLHPHSTICVTKSSLSLSFRSASPKVDLIHDDWFGLAPLASPESMSELSSIGSRASLVNSTSVVVEVNNTPKIMRRSLKIIGNLSTCADDIRNVRNFQKSKIFTRILTNNNTESSSSSNLSYESASSSNRCCVGGSNGSCKGTDESGATGCNEDSEFQSAEDILDNVLASAGCKDFFNSESNFLETHFDLLQERTTDSPTIGFFRPTQVISANQEIDQDLIANIAMDLNLDEKNRAICIQKTTSVSQPSSSADSGSACRTPSDITKNVTFNPQVITVPGSSAYPHHSSSSIPGWRQLFRGRQAKHQRLEPSSPLPTVTAATPIKTILSSRKHGDRSVSGSTSSMGGATCSAGVVADTGGGDEAFCRTTEALPLLSGLSGVAMASSSPGFARRMNYVYPAETVVVQTQTHGESTV
nr:unnamed protein product [Callosobruchus chinensis]